MCTYLPAVGTKHQAMSQLSLHSDTNKLPQTFPDRLLETGNNLPAGTHVCKVAGWPDDERGSTTGAKHEEFSYPNQLVLDLSTRGPELAP